MKNIQNFAALVLLFFVTTAVQAAHVPHPQLDLAARQARSRAASITKDAEIYFRHTPGYKLIVANATTIRSIANEIVLSRQLPADAQRMHAQFELMEQHIDSLEKLTCDLQRFEFSRVIRQQRPIHRDGHPIFVDRHRHHYSHADRPLTYRQSVRHINLMVERLHEASHDLEQSIHRLKKCGCAYCKSGGQRTVPDRYAPYGVSPRPSVPGTFNRQSDGYNNQNRYQDDRSNRSVVPPAPENYTQPRTQPNGPRLLPPAPSQPTTQRTSYPARGRTFTFGGIRITLSE